MLNELSPDLVAATELAGEPIIAKLTHAPGNDAPIGGLKIVAENGWFAARPSGTEDIYKIYAESFKGREHLSGSRRRHGDRERGAGGSGGVGAPRHGSGGYGQPGARCNGHVRLVRGAGTPRRGVERLRHAAPALASVAAPVSTSRILEEP